MRTGPLALILSCLAATPSATCTGAGPLGLFGSGRGELGPKRSFRALGSGAAKGGPSGGLPFVEDDYPRALAEARRRGVPLFIDAWAPWCHTCLSMKAVVFPDPALARFASRFVWLSIDAERDENQPLVTRLGVRALPTLYLWDAAREVPTLAWAGSLSAVELAALLDRNSGEGKAPEGTPHSEALLRVGHGAHARGEEAKAIGSYREALREGGPSWPGRSEALDALVTALSAAGRSGDCIAVGFDAASSLPPGTALANVLRSSLQCGEKLAGTAPERARIPALVDFSERVAEDPSQPILDDDRSDLYDFVVSARTAQGDATGAQRVASAWAAFVDRKAGEAPSPAARAVFDSHRLAADIALGTPERAIPMLEASARDFPSDYNPPARLGAAYMAMKRYDDAIDALRRALALAYGPRRLRMWSLEADAFLAKGDVTSAREVLRTALGAPPLGPGYDRLREPIRKKLAAISPRGM